LENSLIKCRVEAIAFEFFQNRDISEKDFKYFIENLDRTLIKTIICAYKGEFVNLENKESSCTYNLRMIDIFWEMLTCDFENLPLYINEPFEEILTWRLNHNI